MDVNVPIRDMIEKSENKSCLNFCTKISTAAFVALQTNLVEKAMNIIQ